MAFTNQEIESALNWRYATKAYDAQRQISAKDWATLEDAMIKAPSSAGIQPYKVIVITDPNIRQELRGAAFGQPQITDASHLVVFAAKKSVDAEYVARAIDRIVEYRGVERSTLTVFEENVSGLVKNLAAIGEIDHWSASQAFISLGFLVETAALLNIDTTPMGGFDAQRFDEILGLDDHTSVVVAALGYRDTEKDWLAQQAKVRWKNEDFFIRR